MTNSSKVAQLDPVSFPLHGSRLIEASAGTGKTFTIALLYTRLILGQDLHGNGFQRPLTPKEILVVTFTELAAGELRDRIRARLVEAADCFRNQDANQDQLLVQLRNSYAEELWPACAWRLQMASEGMDEASIATIHSWCNRMLVEHAFDTRGLFNRELVTDSRELLTQVVEDYWRYHFYPLQPEQANQISNCFTSPAALERQLEPLLQPTISGISYQGTPLTADLSQIQQELQRQAQQQQQLFNAEQECRQHWAQHWHEIQSYLLSIRASLNGTSHSSTTEEKFNELLEQIAIWAQQQGTAPSKLYSFASGALKFKKNQEPTEPAPELVEQAFNLMARINQLNAEQPAIELSALILAHAANWVQQQYDQRMQQLAQMGFNDLLVQLEQALDPQIAGTHAKQLANTLRECFPVAMIDEFQDTDPIQYSIFDRVYQVAASHDSSGLFMIGDPKQSIYSFRGADINTYLLARRATTGRHYTLKKNYRSTAPLVAACNAIFSHAEQHPQGAFGYQNDSDNQIPFIEVEAQGKSEQLLLHGQPVTPIRLWYFNGDEVEGLSTTSYRQQAAAVAANQIAQWLQAAASGDMGFGQKQIERPLQPADIAILVRSATEASSLSTALQLHGIASVYLSDRESLLASQEAEDCLHWLRACANPGNEALVKAALGTLTLDLPLSQLLAWQDDELEWEQQTQFFYQLQQSWQRQGVLVMLQLLLQHFQLPARLLAKSGGERSLTNLLHLAEWLQQASVNIDGEQALIRHLAQQLGSNDEQSLLRLESDAQRIKILTIHKSKGLEYPLVVLPFISAWRDIDGKDRQVNFQIETHTYSEVAGNQQFAKAWQQANQERIREDLRLLYVALTRASHALYLGVAPLKNGQAKKPQIERSALGHILNGGAAFADAAQVREAFAQLAGPLIQLEPAPEISPVKLPAKTDEQLEPARSCPNMSYLGNWWIASYSALRFGHEPTSLIQQEPESARQDQQLELSLHTTSTELPIPFNTGHDSFIHAFPRGANWGTFLHGLFEWAARHQYGELQGFVAAVADDAGRLQVIERRCQLRNIQQLAQPLAQWLREFLQQTWHGTGFSLADLATDQIAVELEFLLELHEVDSVILDQLISTHSTAQLGKQMLSAASPNRLNGLLKGFIDLVVEHDGRYYIIDWKSNHLGDSAADYSQQRMQDAIAEYRYDVQYMLYILALHRQLSTRLPDYDYDQHMGGAIYAFVRGWQNSDTQGLFMDCPPRGLIEELDQLFSQEAQP